jgi:hypothetical protein
MSMSDAVPFILRTYDEWKAGGASYFSTAEYEWTFSSNVVGDNISISSADGSNKRRYIIQSRGLLLAFLKEYV